MKKLIITAITSSILASYVFAVSVEVLDIKEEGSPNMLSINISVKNNSNAPETKALIFSQINFDSRFMLSGMSLRNIDEGKYRLSLTHKCEKEKIYRETLQLSVQSDADGESIPVSIPFTINCKTVDNNDTSHFETEHPYANNENISKLISIPAYECPPGMICPAVMPTYTVKIEGETEKNYDFIKIYGVREDHVIGNQLIDDELYQPELLGTYSGLINKEIVSSYNNVLVEFTSDYSITKNGVSVDIQNGNGFIDIQD